MIIFKKSADISHYLSRAAKAGRKIGFCPTMGALHDGHISLVNASKKEADLTVASIFVNPTQFNDPNDFKNYPITLESDIDMLEGAGTDLLFLPSVDEIYPKGIEDNIQYDLGYLDQILEGKYRPGHFQGVCRVVDRLLQIIEPHFLYLGQKDYQQCMVIKELVEIRNYQAVLRICPTLREPDGLARSSRNRRLSVTERSKAPVLYESLCVLKDNLEKKSLVPMIQTLKDRIEKAGFQLDYLETALQEDLEPRDSWDGREKLVALVAATIGNTRLIDNLLLN